MIRTWTRIRTALWHNYNCNFWPVARIPKLEGEKGPHYFKRMLKTSISRRLVASLPIEPGANSFRRNRFHGAGQALRHKDANEKAHHSLRVQDSYTTQSGSCGSSCQLQVSISETEGAGLTEMQFHYNGSVA